MKKHLSQISPYLAFFLLVGAVLVPAFFAPSLSGVAREAGPRIAFFLRREKIDSLIAPRLASDTLGAHSYTAAYDECVANWGWSCDEIVDGVGAPYRILISICEGARAIACGTSAVMHVASHTTQCSDLLDNDGDTKIDYNADRGCSSSSDDSEAGGGPSGLVIGGGSSSSASVALEIGGSSGPVEVDGNAYRTSVDIKWSVFHVKSCTSSNSWWNGELQGGTGDCDGVACVEDGVAVRTAGTARYILSCTKIDSAPGGNPSDSIDVIPRWNSKIDRFWADRTQVSSTQTVTLNWRGTDLRSCTGTNWNFPSASLNSRNTQTGSITVGPITEDTTYKLLCTGFDGQALSEKQVDVDVVSDPTPYFFINNINLILVGPGSGGKSNKAQIGVTAGGGFVGNIALSASSPELTGAGDPTFHFDTATISCGAVTGCTTAYFWVELSDGVLEDVYIVTLTANPVPNGFETQTKDIELRVRKFAPAFEEI